MNAIDLLLSDHRDLETRFAALLKMNAPERAPAFEPIADLLVSHVLVEEEHFYPAVRASLTEAILLESLEEHLSLKRLVADLLARKLLAPPQLEALAQTLEKAKADLMRDAPRKRVLGQTEAAAQL
jgi:hemerythrin superfamily protein